MSDSVDTISEAFALQHEDMRLTHDLMGGTKAMLAAGERYIPREDGEEPASWNIRLHRTVLFNVYKRTLRYLGGRVFEKPVVLGGDTQDARYNDFVEDVDKQGHNLSVWSRHVFEEGLNDGVTFCVIDYSDVKTRRMNGATQYQLPDGTWADKTEAADRANGWGPYFIHVDARQVLDARMEWRSGKPIVTHFRYQETLEQPNGKWSTGTYQQIRTFFYDDAGRAAWQVWSNQDEDGDTAEFTMRDEGFFSIGVIPVVWFMPGEKRTPMTAEPALIDLAQLNKRHWQATSSQFEMREYVRRPVWFGRRLGTRNTQNGEMKIVFGAGILCNADDDNAMLQSLGIDAGSVAAGRQELQNLENSMALYGLQLLQPKTGAITATESLRDAEENNSTLKAWALQFQDFLENCMRLVAKWWGQDDGPSVKVNTDFANAMDASFLLEMFRAQVISAQTFLELVKNMGILPDDFAVDDEAAKIAGGLMVNGGPGGVAGLAQRLRVGGI